jgi:CRISPR type I-E-associated protein CasB/Cse2
MLRTVFILGGIDPKQFTAEKMTVGKAFANTDKGTPKENRLTPVGVRLVQVDRATDGRDIKQLRRLIDYLEPRFYWPSLAKTLYYWDQESVKEGKSLPTNKKQMLEDYFRAKYTSTSN